MFVRNRMSSPAITVREDTSFQDALKLMHEQDIRRLPVLNKHGKLTGIVSERDLLHAAPSSATTLSMWEMHYLLAKLMVKELMTKDVITTTPDTPIEDAARLMVSHKVGGLPVLDEQGNVVGVITETNVFEAFLEMLAAGHSGVRLTLDVPARKGVLSMLASTIFDLGGSIESVGTFYGETEDERQLVIKVRDVTKEQLVETLEALGDHIVDARNV